MTVRVSGGANIHTMSINFNTSADMNDGNSKLYLADSNGEMQLLERGKFFPPAAGNKTVTNQSMSLQYDDAKH